MLAVSILYLLFTAIMFLNSHLVLYNPYPLVVAGTRTFGGGLFLLLVYFIQHRASFLSDIKCLMNRYFVGYSLAMYFFASIGFSWSVRYIDPVKACFLIVLVPFITALMLYFGYEEKLTYKKAVGLTIGLVSVIPIVLTSSHGVFRDVPFHLSVLGYVFFFLTILAFSCGWIINRDMLRVTKAPLVLITGGAMTFGSSLTLLVSWLIGGNFFAFNVTTDFWPLIAFFSIITAFAYNLYSFLLTKYSATFIAFASFLEPVFGLLFGVVMFGHSISMITIIALLTLGVGLFVFYQEELRLR